MTTALAAQLAQVRAITTNPLDLQAQKKAHSRSLLFDAKVAATQDFDSIYQICYEGFEELCHLDSRFSVFANSLFSEQSKREDRTQMTAAQNEQLDVVLEDFLGLVGSKLLLKPALKAVEWLIRRFRVHNSNIQCLILTFLPYHTAPIFPALLSILPDRIPPNLRFLHPYIESLAYPPRHVLVYTASTVKLFLATLSSYVLRCSRLGYHYPAMISFWASVTSEAVANMVDQARSARREAQKQNREDVVLFILPILNDGLSVQNVPDLRVGCYMILTVLAPKADLDDRILTTMMEAVTSDWTRTSHAGLICLAVLAQQRQTANLPKRVLRAVLKLDTLEDDLLMLSKMYKVHNLVLGLTLGKLDGLKKARDVSGLRLIRTVLEAGLMSESEATIAVRYILSMAQTFDPKTNPDVDIQGSLAGLILRLADSETLGPLMRNIVNDSTLNTSDLEMRLQRVSGDTENAPDSMIENAYNSDTEDQSTRADFEKLTRRIPTRTACEISFLSHSDSYVYGSLAQVYVSISSSETFLAKFSDMPVLRKSLAMSEPFFLSFFVRIWCGDSPASARAAAIQTVTEYLKEEAFAADVQLLLPYVLFALADTSPKVRRAATKLILVLALHYARVESSQENQAKGNILGREQIYGQGKRTEEVVWLSTKEVSRFLRDLLVPGLEECLVDNCHISQLLSDSLNGSRHGKNPKIIQKELKTSLRLAIFSSLCSHVVNTPLYAVKFRLLTMLNRVQKVSCTSRTKLLLPVLSTCSNMDREQYLEICQKQQLDPAQLLEQVVGIVTPLDREGVQTLKTITETKKSSQFPALKVEALQRMKSIWPSFKADLQYSLSATFLELAIGRAGDRDDETGDAEVMETLRALPLSASILRSFLENLPTISSAVHDKSSAPKRRRTSHGHSMETAVLDKEGSNCAIKKITLVLELVEESRTECHPELLKGLFQVLSDLQHAQCQSSIAIDYLLVLTMDCVFAIVNVAETTSSRQIDSSAIRADSVIDCIRSTTSPQVRNTALLLVSTLASVTPELILHSVMPVFTFMGSGILRQDDDFSAYVVKQTMDSVIPRLVHSMHKRQGDPFVGVSDILLSFAVAFEHIPSQRRLDLFASLIEKVGPAEYLFALLAILMDKYQNNRKGVLRFAVELTSRYDVNTQVKTADRYMDLILESWKPKPTMSASILLTDPSRKAEGTTSVLLPLLTAILGNEALVLKAAKILAHETDDAVALRASYTYLLKGIFVLSNETDTNTKAIIQVLDKAIGLLPIPDLIAILEGLLINSPDNIRIQVLRSFEHRLNSGKLHAQASKKACLAILPRLTSIVEETYNISLKHVALACMDRVVERFGKKDVEAVIEAAHIVSSDSCLTGIESSIRTAAFLCLATMVEVSGDVFIPIIPHALEKGIESLEASIRADTEDASLHNAVYSFVVALIIYLPWMIAGPDLDRLLSVSHESANAEMGDECDEMRVDALRLIPKQVEAQECFSALDRTWTSAMTEGPLAVKEHLETLAIAIEQQPKSVVVKQSETLGLFFANAFDLRRIQLSPRTEDSYEEDEIKEVEEAVNSSAIAMIYKLSDATFRPLFSGLMDWATTSLTAKDKKGKIYRQTTWYTFLSKFFDTLKSIVTTYASFIIEDAVDILNNPSLEDADSMYLWRRVVETLHKSFEHDQDEFYQSPSHFTPISTALLSQLAHAAQVPMIPELIPAIAELAVATDSATHHKEMNAAILKHMRSDSAAVRLAAVQCERALTDRLGEEWLALLPEMLPFMSELQEDDDAAVERETLRWIERVESILGENLGPMLQ